MDTSFRSPCLSDSDSGSDTFAARYQPASGQSTSQRSMAQSTQYIVGVQTCRLQTADYRRRPRSISTSSICTQARRRPRPCAQPPKFHFQSPPFHYSVRQPGPKSNNPKQPAVNTMRDVVMSDSNSSEYCFVQRLQSIVPGAQSNMAPFESHTAPDVLIALQCYLPSIVAL